MSGEGWKISTFEIFLIEEGGVFHFICSMADNIETPLTCKVYVQKPQIVPVNVGIGPHDDSTGEH